MEKRFEIGNFIYQLRTEKGLTQKELAELMGVTDKAVSKWETGSSMMRVEHLDKLSQILGCTREELLLGHRMDVDSSVHSDTEEISSAPSINNRERRCYISAYRGIQLLIKAEIMTLIILVISGISFFLLSNDSPFFIEYIIFMLTILITVFYIAGLVIASKDEYSFKTALWFLIVGFALNIVASLLRHILPAIFSILAVLISLPGTICILNGIRALSFTFINFRDTVIWDRIVRIGFFSFAALEVTVFILSITILSSVRSTTVSTIISLIIYTLSIARNTLYLIHLKKTKIQLGLGYYS